MSAGIVGSVLIHVQRDGSGSEQSIPVLYPGSPMRLRAIRECRAAAWCSDACDGTAALGVPDEVSGDD